MVRKVLLAMTLFLFATTIYAQYRIDTIYYDKEWVQTQVKPFAEYYRVIITPDDSTIHPRFKDYFINGVLQGEGQIVKLGVPADSLTIFDGEIVSYYRNGQKENVLHYKYGRLDGEQTHYYDNGLVERQYSLFNGHMHGLYTQFLENDNFIQLEYAYGKPKYPYYIYGNADGQILKIKTEDDRPYYETPEESQRQTIFRQGERWEYYNCNGFVVALNMDNEEFGLQANIIVTNNSIEPIIFDAHDVTTILVNKNGERIALETYDIHKYMKKINRRQFWEAFAVGMAEGLATANAGYSTTTSTSSTYSYGNISNYGSGRAYDNRGNYAYGNWRGHSTYSGVSNTYITTRSYDASAAYQTRVMSAQRMADFSNAQWQERESRKAGYIQKTTVAPGESVSGYVVMEKKRGVEMYVTIKINGIDYKFYWR